MTSTLHKSVLLKESLDALDLHTGGVFVDATLGGGGHSAEVIARFGKEMKIVAIDLDQAAIDAAMKRLESGNVQYYCGSFRNIDLALAGQKANGELFDLGWNADQFEAAERGFSFQKDGPLKMMFSQTETPGPKIGVGASAVANALPRFTARDIVNSWEEQNIADVIYAYGEERYSRRIARAICEARTQKPIETTFELVNIIGRAVPFFYKKGKTHFATRTFQALRIAVNDELSALKEGLWKGFDSLAPGGRMAVISFHSLEDRIVKRYFKEKADQGEGELVTKKPIVPSDEEIQENRRSRSAKLRVLQKKS